MTAVNNTVIEFIDTARKKSAPVLTLVFLIQSLLLQVLARTIHFQSFTVTANNLMSMLFLFLCIYSRDFSGMKQSITIFKWYNPDTLTLPMHINNNIYISVGDIKWKNVFVTPLPWPLWLLGNINGKHYISVAILSLWKRFHITLREQLFSITFLHEQKQSPQTNIVSHSTVQ